MALTVLFLGGTNLDNGISERITFVFSHRDLHLDNDARFQAQRLPFRLEK